LETTEESICFERRQDLKVVKPLWEPEVKVGQTEERKKEKKPGSKGHDGIGLKGHKQFPEKARLLQINDQTENSYQHRERCDGCPDPGDGFVPFSPQKIGGRRKDERPCTQPGPKEIDGYDPIPNDMNMTFHRLSLALSPANPCPAIVQKVEFSETCWVIFFTPRSYEKIEFLK